LAIFGAPPGADIDLGQYTAMTLLILVTPLHAAVLNLPKIKEIA